MEIAPLPNPIVKMGVAHTVGHCLKWNFVVLKSHQARSQQILGTFLDINFFQMNINLIKNWDKCKWTKTYSENQISVFFNDLSMIDGFPRCQSYYWRSGRAWRDMPEYYTTTKTLV